MAAADSLLAMVWMIPYHLFLKLFWDKTSASSNLSLGQRNKPGKKERLADRLYVFAAI
jgi:hypothetical protein